MKSRRSLLIATLLVVVAMTLGVLEFLPPRHGITKANFNRIQDGMAFDEVKVIFGGPDSFTDPSIEGRERRGELVWVNDDKSGAVICFDEKGEVFDKSWGDSTEDIREKLCRWIRWPWWK